jgi:hypothetical protein
MQMDIPADWIKIKVNDKFAFWIPPGLAAVRVRGVDSHVQRWETEKIVVHFDFGRFSDPLTLYSRKKSHVVTAEQISGRSATIVSFERDDGWQFTAIHFPDLGKDTSGQVVKLTLVVETDPKVSKEVPLKIVKSVLL